jgi:hypothetical protein
MYGCPYLQDRDRVSGELIECYPDCGAARRRGESRVCTPLKNDPPDIAREKKRVAFEQRL